MLVSRFGVLMAAMNKVIHTENAPEAIGPYSQAVKNGNLIFTSGQICINPVTGELNNPDFETETQQVLNNINAILKESGSSLKNIVKCTVYLKDLKNFSIINTVFTQYFSENPPARAAVEVSGLPMNVNVEIDAIASME